MVAEKKKEGHRKEKGGKPNCFVVEGWWDGLGGKRI